MRMRAHHQIGAAVDGVARKAGLILIVVLVLVFFPMVQADNHKIHAVLGLHARDFLFDPLIIHFHIVPAEGKHGELDAVALEGEGIGIVSPLNARLGQVLLTVLQATLTIVQRVVVAQAHALYAVLSQHVYKVGWAAEIGVQAGVFIAFLVRQHAFQVDQRVIVLLKEILGVLEGIGVIVAHRTDHAHQRVLFAVKRFIRA